MLAVSTSEGLAFLDPSSIQDPPIKISCPRVTSLAMSPVGNVVCGVYEGKAIMLLSEEGGMKEVFRPIPAQGDITAVVMREGEKEALFAQGSRVYSYDLLEGKVTGTVLDAHKPTARIRALTLSTSFTHVASVTSSLILIQPLSSFDSPISIKAPSPSTFTTAVFSPLRRATLVTGHKDGKVLVWDTNTPSAPLRQIQAVKGEIVDICFGPPNKAGKTLYAVASREGELAVLDPEDDKETPFRMSVRGSVPLTTVAFLPSGMAIVVGTEDGRLVQHDLKTFGKSQTSVTVDIRKGKIIAIAAAPGKPDKMGCAALASVSAKPAPLAERHVNAPSSPPTRHRESKASVKAAVSPTSRSLGENGKTVDGRQAASGKNREVDGVASKPSPTERPPTQQQPSTTDSGSVVRRSSITAEFRRARLEAEPTSSRAGKARSVEQRAGLEPAAEAGPSNPIPSRQPNAVQPRRERRVVLHTPTLSPAPPPDPSPPPAPAPEPAPAPARLSFPEPASTSLALVHSPRKPGSSAMLDQLQLNQVGAPGAGAEILRTLLDWRAESARATRNLHLDVLRGARVQKEEIRRLMMEMREEVGELRKENERLRGENERLRRGF